MYTLHYTPRLSTDEDNKQLVKQGEEEADDENEDESEDDRGDNDDNDDNGSAWWYFVLIDDICVDRWILAVVAWFESGYNLKLHCLAIVPEFVIWAETKGDC